MLEAARKDSGLRESAIDRKRDFMLARLCKEIHRLFLERSKESVQELRDKTWELSRYFRRNRATPELIEPIIGLEGKLIHARGPNKQFLEEKLFQTLFDSALSCAPEDSGKKRMPLEPALIESATNARERLRHTMALKLVGFAMEILKLEIPRDAFNNKRKALAMDLIGRVAAYYDIPEAMELCLAALKSKKNTLILAAAEFYDNYGRDRNLSLTPEMVQQLDDIVSKTKDRSSAVTALHLQVEAGLIDEFEALSRIDDWKERNLGRL